MVVPEPQAVAVGIKEHTRRVERVDVQAVAPQLHVVDDAALQHVADVGAGPDPVPGEKLVRYRTAADPFRAFEDGYVKPGPREIICGDQPVVAGAHDDAIFRV